MPRPTYALYVEKDGTAHLCGSAFLSRRRYRRNVACDDREVLDTDTIPAKTLPDNITCPDCLALYRSAYEHV